MGYQGFRSGYEGQRGSSSYGRPEMFQATCSGCGGTATVPFKPSSGKPIYCSSCYRAQRSGGAVAEAVASRPVFIENDQTRPILASIALGINDPNAKNVVIRARAGTGKTTTIVEGMYRLPSGLVVAFLAFNRSIADTLKDRCKAAGASASTFHSLGGNAIAKALNKSLSPQSGFVDSYKVQRWILPRDLPRDVKDSVAKLVGHCKDELVNPKDRQALLNLAAYHNVDLTDYPEDVIGRVPAAFTASLNHLDHIDYHDMIYMALTMFSGNLNHFDMLFVDEAQDLNPSRQQLSLLVGDRIAIVGDEKQAIYAFAGADPYSLDTMTDLLEKHNGRGVEVFPLTRTRRCSKIVVAFSREDCADFEALPEAPDGKLCLGDAWGVLDADPNNPKGWKIVPKSEDELKVICKPGVGSAVLCRTNGPLVSFAYQCVREGRPVAIQGRDIGDGLENRIQKLVPDTASTVKLIEEAGKWYFAQYAQITAANGEGRADAKLEALEDAYQCILALCDGLDTVSEVIGRIRMLFQNAGDPKRRITCSSVHRAKGGEWEGAREGDDGVFVIHPELIPHPMAKTDDAYLQELNLRYVARTRVKGGSVLHYHNLAGMVAAR